MIVGSRVAAMARALIAVLAALALAGCGNDGAADRPTGTASSSTPSQTPDGSAAKIQFRRVIASEAAGQADTDSTRTELAAITCPEDGATAVEAAERDLACDDKGTKYLLSPAAYEGTAVSAAAAIPDNQAGWAVNVKLDAEGARALTKLSTELSDNGDQVAIEIDGVVLSASGFDGVITTGELQITGAFNERSAHELADRLS
jgi:preprotein translocase subunit SecD